MKALIVEIERKNVLVMDKDGRIHRIPRKVNHAVGHEVVMETKSNMRRFRLGKYAFTAAALILTVGLSFYIWADRIVAAKINVDINPSVEVWLNNMGGVIKVVALNPDGQNLLSAADFNTGDPMAALRMIVESARQVGYFAGNETDVIVVSIKAGSELKIQKLKASIDSQLTRFISEQDIMAVVYVEKHFDDSVVNTADNGVSPGKMLLIEKILENDSDAVAGDYYDSSINEILDEIIVLRNSDNPDKPVDEDIDRLVDDTEKMTEQKSKEQDEHRDSEITEPRVSETPTGAHTATTTATRTSERHEATETHRSPTPTATSD